MDRLKKNIILASILVFCLVAGLVINRATWFTQDKHFTKLAVSFTKNDLFLNPSGLPAGDYADYRGRQYLFFGPLPSIILIPFVLLFGENFPQISLSFVALALTYAALYLLLRKLSFGAEDSLWLVNFFVFGTVLYFVSLVNISAYLVQAVAIPFIVLALYEYFSRRRWLIIGILLSAAILTRISYLGFLIFFLLEIYRQRSSGQIIRNLFLIFLPVILTLVILGVYNFRRFNSFFDTGYTRNVTVVKSPTSNYHKGAFSLVHIPGNFYNLFIAAPEVIKDSSVDFVLNFPYLKVSGIGLAIWFTSPLFIYLFKSRRKPYTFSAVISIVALVFPSLVYFGIGTTQFGYRYSLDFLPLLFLILVSAFEKGLDNFAKFLIILGIIFNCFYMLSIWNSYPLFFWLK